MHLYVCSQIYTYATELPDEVLDELGDVGTAILSGDVDVAVPCSRS